MKRLLIIAFFTIVCFGLRAQSVGEYNVECKESGPYLVTPTDSVGVQLDIDQITSDLSTIDIELEDIAIQEAQLQLLAKKRQLQSRKSFLTDITAKIKESCEQ